MISPLEKCESVHGNQAIGVQFADPKFPADFIFSVKRLEILIDLEIGFGDADGRKNFASAQTTEAQRI